MSAGRNNRQPGAIIEPSPPTPSRRLASRPEITRLSLPLFFSLVLLVALSGVAGAQQHRAEQTREIT